MTLTERKLAANRANAAKSTGPRTVDGKHRSSRNAIKHELLSNSIVLEGGESRDRFTAILNSFTAEFRPESPNEEVFIEKMVVAHWRLRRLWAYETASIKHEISRQTGTDLEADAPTRAMLAMHSLGKDTRHHELMCRYENLFDRAHYRALEGIRKTRDPKNDFAKRTHSDHENKDIPKNNEPIEAPDEPKELPTEPTECL